jgi:hypothetical protein
MCNSIPSAFRSNLIYNPNHCCLNRYSQSLQHLTIILCSTPGQVYLQIITLKPITCSMTTHNNTYSQTFENKSSFPELNDAAGFAAAAPPVGAEACGALLHPPKSSSAVTCGAEIFGVAPKPPEGAPHPLLAGIGAAAGAAGFESPQASLDEPHTSLLLMFAKEEVGIGAGAAGFDDGAGVDRLKAELLYAAGAGFEAAGAGTGEPPMRSNRSFP